MTWDAPGLTQNYENTISYRTENTVEISTENRQKTLKGIRKVQNYPADLEKFKKNYKYIFNIFLKINMNF